MTNKILEFKFHASRGRDYRYNTCSLYVNGKKVVACSGGGYEMKGSSLGYWIANTYADRLMKLKPEDMPEQGHWEPYDDPRRFCPNIDCEPGPKTARMIDYIEDYFPPGTEKCPRCGTETKPVANVKLVIDGHYFYGLTYHDPNDPGEAESSKYPTERHTVPLIDGGFSSVERIMKAIGLTLEYVPPPGRQKRRDSVYILHDERMKEAACEPKWSIAN
jgi:hypothetical protein